MKMKIKFSDYKTYKLSRGRWICKYKNFYTVGATRTEARVANMFYTARG